MLRSTRHHLCRHRRAPRCRPSAPRGRCPLPGPKTAPHHPHPGRSKRPNRTPTAAHLVGSPPTASGTRRGRALARRLRPHPPQAASHTRTLARRLFRPLPMRLWPIGLLRPSPSAPPPLRACLGLRPLGQSLGLRPLGQSLPRPLRPHLRRRPRPRLFQRRPLRLWPVRLPRAGPPVRPQLSPRLRRLGPRPSRPVRPHLWRPRPTPPVRRRPLRLRPIRPLGPSPPVRHSVHPCPRPLRRRPHPLRLVPLSSLPPLPTHPLPPHPLPTHPLPTHPRRAPRLSRPLPRHSPARPRPPRSQPRPRPLPPPMFHVKRRRLTEEPPWLMNS